MKKNKVVLFSVISALAVGGATALSILPNTGFVQNLVNASTEKIDSCTPVWTSRNQPTLDEGGNATVLNSKIETKYQKASLETGYHVVLAPNSVMGTSGRAWDGSTGGVINGIHSIKVTFKTDGQKYAGQADPDASPWEPVPEYDVAKVEVKSIFADGTEDTDTVTSGGVVKFDSRRPIGFELRVVADSSAPKEYDPAALRAKIQAVEVKADMAVRYTIKVAGAQAGKVDAYRMSADGKSLVGYSVNLPYCNFLPGEKIAIKAANAGFYLKDTDFDITGASAVQTVIAGEKYPVYVVTVGTENIKIIVNSITEDLPYEGKDFVGSYAMYDYDNSYKNRVTPVVIDAKGKIKINSNTADYTVDENDVLKTTISGKSYTLGTKGTVTYLFNASQNSYKYGVKNAEATYKLGAKYLSGASGSIVEFSTGEKVFTYFEMFLVDGVDNISITADTNDFDTAKIISITETQPAATEASGFTLNTIRTYASDVEYKVSGENKTGTLYFQVGQDHKWSHITRGVEAGTFTGAAGDLVLDGFGKASLDATNDLSYVYDSSTKAVTIDGTQYILDLTAKTYTVKNLINADPWVDAPGKYDMPKSKVVLSFQNGTVTFLNKSSSDFNTASAKYTVSASKVTFTALYAANPDHPSAWTVNVKFVFEIADDLSTLKVISAIDDPHSYTPTEPLTKGTVLKAHVEKVDPFETAKTFANGDKSITFEKGKVTFSKSITNITDDPKTYTIEENVITIKYSYISMYTDYYPSETTAKFTLSEDGKTITLTTSLNYSTGPQNDAFDTSISKGTIFTFADPNAHPFEEDKKYTSEGAQILFKKNSFEMLGDLAACTADSYTLKDKVITINYTYQIEWMDGPLDQNGKATFTLSDDLSTITLTTKLVYADMDYAEHTIQSGTVFTLVK